MSKKNSFIFYNEYLMDLAYLDAEDFKTVMFWLSDYQATGKIPDEEEREEYPTLFCLFAVMRRRIDYDDEKYQERAEKNRLNGAKGGRPKKDPLYSTQGISIPDGEIEGKHFLYLIHDITTDEYKIGETKNLSQRRYTIKRPTKNLEVVAYTVDDMLNCQMAEDEILKKYDGYNLGGDWFTFTKEALSELLEKYFANKPNGFLNDEKEIKKPHMDMDMVMDMDISTSSDDDVDIYTAPSAPQPSYDEYTKLINEWNKLPNVVSIRDIRPLSKRDNDLRLVLAEFGWEGVYEGLHRIRDSEYFKKRGCKVSFDTYICNADVLQKLIEGTYDKDYSRHVGGKVGDGFELGWDTSEAD